MFIYHNVIKNGKGDRKQKKNLHFANNEGINITRGEVIGKQRKRDVSDHDTAFWIIG